MSANASTNASIAEATETYLKECGVDPASRRRDGHPRDAVRELVRLVEVGSVSCTAGAEACAAMLTPTPVARVRCSMGCDSCEEDSRCDWDSWPFSFDGRRAGDSLRDDGSEPIVPLITASRPGLCSAERLFIFSRADFSGDFALRPRRRRQLLAHKGSWRSNRGRARVMKLSPIRLWTSGL